MAKKKAAKKRAEGSRGPQAAVSGDDARDPAQGGAAAGAAAREAEAAPAPSEAGASEAGASEAGASEAGASEAGASEQGPTSDGAAAEDPALDDAPDGGGGPREPVVRIAPPTGRRPARWGAPVAKVAAAFDWIEMRLLVLALLGLVALLVVWISITGMSAPLESDSSEGGVFRGILGAIVLGGLSRPLGRRLGFSEARRAALTFVAIAVAILLAPAWRKVGVDYFGHLKTWLQEGSALAMLGGLRGVGTRVTILLALVGGSLAAASGKHINIDVVLRFTPDRLKLPVFAVGSLATSAVLLGASWGFYDYIAIESFNYRPAQLEVHARGEKYEDSTASEEISFVQKRVGQHFFLFRKQLGLDLAALPHVLGGGKWDDPGRMNGRQWNQFLEEGGFRERFTKEEVDGIRALDEDLEGSRIPLVVVPGGGSARNLLIPSMNLMFVAGFFVIALRFLLRLLLVVSGHEQLEDDAASAAGATPSQPAGKEAR